MCPAQVAGVPLDHIGDQAGLAVPFLVCSRFGQGRDVVEVRELFLQFVQFGLETQVLFGPGAVEKGGLAL